MRGTMRWAMMATLLTATALAEEDTQDGGASGGAEPPAEKTCLPACRTGFVCIEDRCVTACNPPCAESERCTAQGECERRVESAPTDSSSIDSEFAADSEFAVDSESSDEPRSSNASWQTRGSRRNTGLMVTGIVATATGGITVLTGTMLLSTGDKNYRSLGIGLAVAGGAALAIGIPMILVGTSPKPRGVSRPGTQPVTASLVVGGRSLLLRGTW
jgi:hypothetical protein